MADTNEQNDGMLSALAGLMGADGSGDKGPSDAPGPNPPNPGGPDEGLAAKLARYEEEVNK